MNTENEAFEALLALARHLRSPEGCPWDRKQSTASFARYLVGEAQELLEAAGGEDDEHVAEEFGDVLFCALMTAVVGEDEGRFSIVEALRAAHAKMIRRHAHLFGEHTAETPEDVSAVWEQVKAEEKRTRAARKAQETGEG